MRIYSMKATFGKLDHQTLTLKPGLNIIEAPNEWGKSTWCAFLISMLYGLDVQNKSPRYHLADQERFLPWSGASMEGRMDLNWRGRDITIERKTADRIPMGQFRAYETHTGLEIPELTAENCGRQLLGVEKDVFTRSGFLSFTDLPVTEDEQLRNRLNALVTTGDESGNADLLAKKLKELKDRCRYRETGLIPQLRLQKEQVERELQEWDAMDQQIGALQLQIAEQEQRIRRLQNHQAALRYQASQQHTAMLLDASMTRDEAYRQMEALRNQTEAAPTREVATKNIQRLSQLQKELSAIQLEEQMLPPDADVPQPPKGFAGCTAKEAVIQAERHRDELNALRPKGKLIIAILLVLGIFLAMYGVFLMIMDRVVLGIICSGVGVVYLFLAVLMLLHGKKKVPLYRKRQAELHDLYQSDDPEQWVEAARNYVREWEAYAKHGVETADPRAALERRKELLVAKIMVVSQGRGLDPALAYWNDILALWDDYADSQCNYRQVRKQFQSLQSIAVQIPPPEPDDLTFSEEETGHLLTKASQTLRQLLSRLGQYQGHADSMSSRHELEEKNRDLEQRLHELEKTYAALDIASKSLEEARSQLRQRFAPRITRSAQEILRQLTNGRYTRLTMSQDFSLYLSAQNEDTLRSRHWCSDGTVDQLYLALRLAVARELLPHAPLVLDDAMVRFDNDRLEAALAILKLEAKHKQVIIFTCHGREQQLLEKSGRRLSIS